MKKNDTLIIPDVHGRDFWMEHVIGFPGDVIFLGDYLDPYPNENITPDEAYETFLEIVKLKLNKPDKITLLIGNHDFHYMPGNELYHWSRFSYINAEKYRKAFKTFKEYLKFATHLEVVDKKYLLTHAGVTREWMEYNEWSIPKSAESMADFLNTQVKEEYAQVGYERWGRFPSGSPIWADIREHNLTEPLGDYIQLVGHTQLGDWYNGGTVICLDCRKVFKVDGETGEIMEV